MRAPDGEVLALDAVDPEPWLWSGKVRSLRPDRLLLYYRRD
jgi:hypothetical protein